MSEVREADYTARCSECGGKGGHPIDQPRGFQEDWDDCPYCVQTDRCALCDENIDCRDRVPDRLIIAGKSEPVCPSCFAEERDEDPDDD